MKATIIDVDTPTRHGFTYSASSCADIASVINDRASNGRTLFGELGSPSGADGFSIDLNRVSHAITDARIEDGKVICTMKILDTPMGKIARELLDAEVALNFRPRGHADSIKDGVISGFTLITVDVVADGA